MTVEERFTQVMRRHLRDEDAALTDHDLVTQAFVRYLRERKEPIIDVNE